MTPRLVATVLDARDPRGLARFWSELLGWPVGTAEETWATVRDPTGASAGLSFQLEPLFRAPVWPAREGTQQMQLHLDLEVADLEAEVARATALGARLEEHQPQDDVRVMRDPEGHLFCLFV